MLTGTLKSDIDRVWDAFWSGGIANPLEVIEQITYLLFVRRLDDLQTIAENKARRTGRPLERRIFPEDGGDVLRWSRFKDADPSTMYETVSNGVFPWLRTLGSEGSTYAVSFEDLRNQSAIATGNLSRVEKSIDKLTAAVTKVAQRR